MNTLPPVGQQQNVRRANGTRRWLLVCLGVIFAVAVLFLWTEYRAFLFVALLFLFLLACPLMHVFMHHGHGGHGTAKDAPRSRADDGSFTA